MPHRPSPTNVSALHVFRILRLISRSDVSLGTAEISRMIGLPVSTVHRALITLEEAQYISRCDPVGQYVIGVMPQHLSRAVFRSFPLRLTAQPYLNLIAEESGETASLCARVGWYQMTILVVHGQGDVYHRTQLGSVTPLHSGIASQAVLAFLGKGEIDRYLAFCRRHQDGPVPDAADLHATCETGRAAGYFTEEADPDVSSIALPIRDPSGKAIASMLLSGYREGAKWNLLQKRALRDDIEARLRDDPALGRTPYAHLDPDDILFGGSANHDL